MSQWCHTVCSQRRRSTTCRGHWISMVSRCQPSTRLEDSWPMSCQLMKLQVKRRSWLVVKHFAPSTHWPLLSLTVHAAVIAINEAVDRGDVDVTAVALRNPNAMLKHLQEALVSVYQEMLCQAKRKKCDHAARRVRLRCFRIQYLKWIELCSALLWHIWVKH